ncbi:MAG: hypothetical protein A2Z20_01335 [Bdellovibrionales bacterium RBG_16_40_8]|nr:MAG: hypothetical protein A2Z20_01335 [Bdellovibrionales bacterium RBG_16_40_8]
MAMKKSDINILIVEDDSFMREALSAAVKRRGYKAVAVAKPDEAQSIVKIKPIHGLIVDVMLPGLNGVDLVLKLKENLIEGAALVLISGIYKDSMFIQDAIKKAEALNYYTKPFDMDVLLSKIEEGLNDYIEVPKVDLHSLLALPFASPRERRKALDHVEEMLGYDLPFVFCILMDAESSGYLNIIDEKQNIYGITFANGMINKVDSESTSIVTKKILISHGFVTESEFGELGPKKSGGDLLKNLISEGLMSPHVLGVAKVETYVSELKKLIGDNKLKINFVPDRKIQPDKDAVDIGALTQYLHQMIDEKLPSEWLKSFYSTWLGHPICIGPQFADHINLLALPILTRAPHIIESFKKELTIEEIQTQHPEYTDEIFYKALHLMMLRKMLIFEEVKRVKNIDEHINRLKSIYDEIKLSNPIEIFKYFGLGDNPRSTEVGRVYKEFAKSHHPDALPPNVSGEVRKLNHELFSKVTAAYDILSNDEKRERFNNEMKQKEAERQIKSDELVMSSATLLGRGQYATALSQLEKAVSLYASERCLLQYWWAKFKASGLTNAEEISDIDKQMKSMSPHMRKTALWVFVSGLVKRFSGDLVGAENDFTRAIGLEQNFMDARRELTQIKANKPTKMTAEDILKGDLSTVFKNLFSRKKGA